MNRSKVALGVSQVIAKVEKIVGIGVALFFGLMVVLTVTDPEQYDKAFAITCTIIMAIGIVLFIMGRKRTKMHLAFKKYVTQLSVDPSGALENLASATNTSVDVVKRDLQYMIKKGFFSDAFINEKENQLVLPLMIQRAKQQEQMAEGESGNQAEMITCICPCCGGKNKVKKGTVGECDYCGSPLS